MKNIIIVGASGMIGGIVLRACLDSSEVNQVTSIARRPSGMEHSKLNEIIYNNYMNYSGVIDVFKNQDVAHFCIGVYTGAVPDDEFKKITFDFAKVFADAVKDNSPKATLCFLSGAGADLTEKSRMSFAKYKGMAENYLMSKAFENLNIFRPGYIYPVENREEPNFSYRIFRKLYPIMKSIFPGSVITSQQLGQAMYKAGMQGNNHGILENVPIKNTL